MDEKDKQILNMIKGDARKSYQEIGDALGISRVAAKKRTTNPLSEMSFPCNVILIPLEQLQAA